VTTDAATGSKTIDTTELIRVFGKIEATHGDTVTTVVNAHQNTPSDEQSLHLLQQENQHLKTEKELLLKNLEDVRQAMLLIESRLPATPEPVTQSAVKNHGNSGENSGFSRQTG